MGHPYSLRCVVSNPDIRSRWNVFRIISIHRKRKSFAETSHFIAVIGGNDKIANLARTFTAVFERASDDDAGAKPATNGATDAAKKAQTIDFWIDNMVLILGLGSAKDIFWI